MRCFYETKRKPKAFCLRNGKLLLLALLLLNVSLAAAQSIRVSGIVKDAEGPLPGVSIRVKGTNQSLAQTTDQGVFKLDTEPGTVLVFSYIGYTSKEVDLSAEQADEQGNYLLNVILGQGEGNNLEEVVVVGFGTQKKLNLTGAVGTVDAKALANRPVRNVSQALQGLVAGLNISQSNGSLESNPSINIRGAGTLGSSNSNASPLVLIDGMEGSINLLNPQDIENVSYGWQHG